MKIIVAYTEQQQRLMSKLLYRSEWRFGKLVNSSGWLRLMMMTQLPVELWIGFSFEINLFRILLSLVLLISAMCVVVCGHVSLSYIIILWLTYSAATFAEAPENFQLSQQNFPAIRLHCCVLWRRCVVGLNFERSLVASPKITESFHKSSIQHSYCM